MRPPICAVCGVRFSPGESGGSAIFADYDPEQERMLGHPKGVDWFCVDHFEAAKALSEMTAEGAIRKLRR